MSPVLPCCLGSAACVSLALCSRRVACVRRDLKVDAGKLSHWTTFGLGMRCCTPCDVQYRDSLPFVFLVCSGLEMGVAICMAIVFVIMIAYVVNFSTHGFAPTHLFC